MQLVSNLKRKENEIPDEGGLRRYMNRAKLAIYFHTVLYINNANFSFCSYNTVYDRDEIRANIHIRLQFLEIPPFLTSIGVIRAKRQWSWCVKKKYTIR